MTTYQYQKLTEPDAIRLILLQPSADPDSPLYCTLLSTSLPRCHKNLIDKYTALSYVWGDPARSHLINVDETAMYITSSLNSALRHLRNTHRSRLIWADAICINQDNIKERNQQVKQMGWVYRLAAHTIIYLGEGTPQTILFIETLQSRSTVEWKPPALEADCIEQSHSLLDFEAEAARKWILAHPWFKRVWILQELVLSRDPWKQCGFSVAPWHSFYNHISEIAARRTLSFEEIVVEDMENLHMQHQFPTYHLQGHDEVDRNPPSFAERLYDHLKLRKGFGVTDPRDILFANLALLGPLPEDEDTNLIAVDYQKKEAEVFHDLARYIIENHRDARIFSLLDSAEKRSNFDAPSWVPDWACRLPAQFSRLPDTVDNFGHFSTMWYGRPKLGSWSVTSN